jgi:hypothetical protein
MIPLTDENVRDLAWAIEDAIHGHESAPVADAVTEEVKTPQPPRPTARPAPSSFLTMLARTVIRWVNARS